MKILRKISRLLRRDRLDAEMTEEMRHHVELQTELNVKAGMNPEEARYAALRQFGNVASIQEEAREQRGWRWLETLLQDGRFALRQLRKQPGFTAAAVLTLALGVGFVTTLFTIVNGIAFRGLPFDAAHQIVSIGVSSEQLRDITPQQTSCDSLALIRSGPVNLSGEVVASRQPGAFVSRSLFELLRVRPALGRGFLDEDAAMGAPKVVLIGDALWRQDFRSDPAAVGREIRINGETHTIIGVMPAGFGFPRNESLWIPLADDTRTVGALVVGRLKPGVTPQRASDEFKGISSRLLPDESAVSEEHVAAVEVIPFAERSIKGVVRNLLTGILGATFLVLLLACANVANLVLVRAAERGRELALRSALGATRGRLIRQMLTESFVLSAFGATLGAFGAQWGTRLLWSYVGREADLTGGVPFWVNFEMDGSVLGFVIGVTVLASVLTGLVPALRSSRMEVSQQLKDGSAGSGRASRLTGILVNVQMALSVCLVVAAGLFLTLLIDFNRKDLPYDPAQVLTARVSLNEKDHPTAGERTALFNGLLDKLAASPEIAAAAATSAESFRAGQRQIALEGATYARRSAIPAVLTETVTTGYFETLRLQLRDGRIFQSSDTAEAPAVAVVNTAFVTRFGDGRGMVGRRFRVATSTTTDSWITIIGVVTDAGSMKAAQKTTDALFYRPFAQDPVATATLIVRGRGQGTALVDQLRRVVAARDPDLPLNQVYTVQHIIEMERIGINLPGVLLVLCGLGALALASVGVYGVVAFSVRTRTREFGVRMALGASRRDILQLVVGGGLRQLSYGLGGGVLLALGASATLSSMFVGFGRSAYDVWIYLAVVALLAGVGAAALFIPARRAAKVDPMVALRAE